MATGLTFPVRAVTLLPRAAVYGGTNALTRPIIWRALTKGAADGVAYGDASLTIEEQWQVVVDVNEARLASTAAVGGTIFLGTQLWFYEKLKMKDRILQAGQLIQEAKETAKLIENAVKTNNQQIAIAQSQRLEDIGNGLLALNDGVTALDDALIPLADELFDVKNLLGIANTADEIVKVGIIGKTATNAARTLETISILTPKVQSLFKAAEASAKATGTATWLSRTAKGVGLAGGKILILDTIIWGITLGIDLGLNLFMTEEEQANLPLIGFLFEGAGWSPVGAALEWVVVNSVEYFLGEDTAETLYEAFVAMLIAASQAPYVSEMFEIILDFFVNEINGELLVDLTFELPDLAFTDITFDLFKQLTEGDPLIILEVFLYAIIIKIVFKHWVKPMFTYATSSLTGATS